MVAGVGSLGSEYLKVLSLMGIASGKNGKITVIDGKNIQKHNLSSDFGLRKENIGQNKAENITKFIKEFNSSIKINPMSVDISR